MVFFVWWGKVDSNHRRHSQQIYSLSPLATREFPHMKLSTRDAVWNTLIIATNRPIVKHYFYEFSSGLDKRSGQSLSLLSALFLWFLPRTAGVRQCDVHSATDQPTVPLGNILNPPPVGYRHPVH